MEDVLLIQLLKKKGIISERDIHEMHELTSASINSEPIYLSKTNYSLNYSNIENTSEEEAKNIVSSMYHIDNGRKYIGEKFDMYKAKEVCERYRGSIPPNINICDVYIAINSLYHDYCVLFKKWFAEDIDTKIIQSAISYWFNDDDCSLLNKVTGYLKK